MLSNIVIPNSVATICAYAFRDCSVLKEVLFKGNAPWIGTSAFKNVTTIVYYPVDNDTWTSDVQVQYGGSLTWNSYKEAPTLGTAPIAKAKDFGTCGEVIWILTEDDILSITGIGAMKNYSGRTAIPWYEYKNQIKEVVINDGVTAIGNYAFYGMSALEAIHIPDSVTVIGSYAFKGCNALDNVVLPAKLSVLGESAFYGCASLSKIDIPETVSVVRAYTFKNCCNLSVLTLHEGALVKLEDSAFYGTAITELVIPGCLEVIDSYCFKKCEKLISIIFIEGNLQVIGESAFYGCSAIESIVLPDNMPEIGELAFKYVDIAF